MRGRRRPLPSDQPRPTTQVRLERDPNETSTCMAERRPKVGRVEFSEYHHHRCLIDAQPPLYPYIIVGVAAEGEHCVTTGVCAGSEPQVVLRVECSADN